MEAACLQEPAILLKLVNLLDVPVLAYSLAKYERDLSRSSRIYIEKHGWAMLTVRPGMDTDEKQTLLAFTQAMDTPPFRGEGGEAGINSDAVFDLFEIGQTCAGDLFFRSSEYTYSATFDRTRVPRQLNVASHGGVPVSVDGVTRLLIASLVPPMRVQNTVELIFREDQEYDESSSSDSSWEGSHSP